MKIQMKTPLVEMDGDEMTRILWAMIKDKLILPFVELKTEYYDLGLLHRNETKDQVTVDAANATKKYGVAVKCATITPNRQRMEEYPQLTEMWKSPNGTIRSILDGTVFRTPICIDAIKPVVKNWKKPITIARHAYGDVYKSVDFVTDEPGTCTMTFKGESGKEKTVTVQKVDGPAVWQGAHNKDQSIRSFARSCFQYAIDTKQDLWFSTKDTIAKVYDGEFKKIFEEEFEGYKAKFDELGITYFYTLIDDAVARVIRSEGGYIWACKNYDGDVMSDMLATAFGSLAMMSSVLVSPDGNFEYEASVIIPVRNRIRTIRDAIKSVLMQKADFKYNLIIIDNHSTDGTTEAIDEFKDDERLIHIIPERSDLGIGGCWNMGVQHPKCGKFAVQLDSDDVYKDENTLAIMVRAFYEQNCAMVVGTYMMTDFNMNMIAPGIIDHKEWTPANGRNNALRINGLGAPRAFYTPVLREVKVPNTSYGEDYALGLNFSRQYQIGRVYDVVYLCRRWDDNSDASLDIVKMNGHNLYKDRIRTRELQARIEMNKKNETKH